MRISVAQAERVRQRRELTFKHNQGLGRHGWLRLTPAYSVRVVDDVTAREEVRIAVLDPFSGTATTPLVAARRGARATSVDINPFLVWFGRVKTARYGREHVDSAKAAVDQALLRSALVTPALPPPIHDVHRWWSPRSLDFLCRLAAAIDESTAKNPKVRNLLRVAFGRTLMGLSNAAFNHQSISFSEAGSESLRVPAAGDYGECFRRDVLAVLDGALDNPRAKVDVLHGDSRSLEVVTKGSFDLVVTSPPYPNRMSYIRELRPYMYWFGFLKSGREAGELDWQAIGGTWGVATSRVADWRPDGARLRSAQLSPILRRIRTIERPNAGLLANYVERYFHDAWTHLEAVSAKIARGGRVHYIVGNSTFYGVLVPTEALYAEMLEQLGFRGVSVETLRKRNSKKELFEFDVSATR